MMKFLEPLELVKLERYIQTMGTLGSHEMSRYRAAAGVADLSAAENCQLQFFNF